MTLLQRCCATCRYHRPGLTACTGWCAHPARHPGAAVAPFVRERETACRRGWGEDLWEPAEEACGESRVIGLIVWGPLPAADEALDNLPSDLVGYLLRTAE